VPWLLHLLTSFSCLTGLPGRPCRRRRRKVLEKYCRARHTTKCATWRICSLSSHAGRGGASMTARAQAALKERWSGDISG